MITIDKTMSVIVSIVLWILYTAAAKNKNDVNWGSSKQIQQIKTILKNIYSADSVQYHVKNYLPNIIVLSGEPASRKELVYLANLITKNNGLQMCINFEKDILTYEVKQESLEKGMRWLKQAGIKSLYSILDNIDFDIGIYDVINICGHGILKPNIILIGYKHGWFNCTNEDIQIYLNIFNLANAQKLVTIIVRLSPSDSITGDFEDGKLKLQKTKYYENEKLHSEPLINEKEKKQLGPVNCSVKIHDSQFSFIEKRKNGTVDVWWLFDDGGLALIIAHIFKLRSVWKKCTFRIFGVTDEIQNLDTEKNKLKQLLSMYRIQFDFIDVVLANAISQKTIVDFTNLWNQVFNNQEYQKKNTDDQKYNENKLIDNLYVKDLLEAYSRESDLIILSISKPKDKLDRIHMCWLEVITNGLPPCIIIQGNSAQTVTASA